MGMVLLRCCTTRQDNTDKTDKTDKTYKTNITYTVGQHKTKRPEDNKTQLIKHIKMSVQPKLLLP